VPAKEQKWFSQAICNKSIKPYLDAQSNGLAYMIDKMRGQAIFAHVNLVKGERSELSELASNLL